jgi:hypothetical protein
MLAFYETLFPNLPPLVFDFLKRKRDKVVIYTDTSYSTRHYGLGFIIIIDGRCFYLNTVALPWLIHILKRVTQSLKIINVTINQLELLSILCVVLTCGDLLMGHQVWFWCENTVTLSTVIHAYVRSVHLVQMTNEIHLQFARLQITGWFEWVPSQFNISDIPGRPLFPSTDSVKSTVLDMFKWRSTV